MCRELGIHTYFSSPAHPQANGQVEAVNKTIKTNLKTKLDRLKGSWVEELPNVLWAYRTTSRNATGETPYSLSFGAEAVVPVEIGASNYRTQHFLPDNNETSLRAELDLLEERRDQAAVWAVAYQQRSARYYNSKVRHRVLRLGDLVLKKVLQNTKEQGSGSLGPTWEGPYRIIKVVRPGTYRLEDMAGGVLLHPWNVEHLKYYYQ